MASVILFVISNHVLLIILSWFMMGVFMSKLIGINKEWKEAQNAARYALKYYVASSLSLFVSLLILSHYSGSYYLDIIFEQLEFIPSAMLLVSGLLLILAGLIQSALFPFHRWLLSAMTAPTPASALMHAGFINGAGILFTIFASVLVVSELLIVLFIIGGFTAIIAQFVKLLQVQVKHKLACSTIAQMGFMVMQCGLGFFNAAIAHLILHGFYKAYLFLSSGEHIEMKSPQRPVPFSIKPLQAFLVLVFGGIGALFFMWITAKTSFTNSSIFLTLIVAITVGQATYNILKEESLKYIHRVMISAGLFMLGIVLYGIMYNGVTSLMSEVSYALVPQKISTVEVGFGLLFLIGFFLMKLGVYQLTPWLYVKLLNLTQPNRQTVLNLKND
jgi:NAD(P)H-quinone oxidoreductase subunit 5